MTNERDIVTPYYDGLNRGELLLKKCASCGKHIMYPRHRCPLRLSDVFGWRNKP